MKKYFLYIRLVISVILAIIAVSGCSSPLPQNSQEKLEQNHWYLKSKIQNQGELYFENNKMHLTFTPSENEKNRTGISLVCDYYIEGDKITAVVPKWAQNIELYYKINGKVLTLSYLNYEISMEFQ